MWLWREVKRVSRIILCDAVKVELTKFLKLVVEKGASDGFASVGSAPIFKVNGDLLAEGTDTLSADDVRALIQASMTAKQFEDYAAHRDANYAIEHPGLGRFRASAYVQREQPALPEFTTIFRPLSSSAFRRSLRT